MRVEDFVAHWQRHYGGTPLVAHVLRERLRDRWLRIHSLPGSKRYPDTDEERAEVLRRQNTVFLDLIGDGGRCVLVYADYRSPDEISDTRALDALDALGAQGFATLREADTGLAADLPQRMAPLTFHERALDPTLLSIANDELDHVLFVGIDGRCILAPYDGGMDIIVERRGRRDELRRRYAVWLSPHPSGT